VHTFYSDALSGKTVCRGIKPATYETAWEDVCLKALVREKWKELTVRYASHWKDSKHTYYRSSIKHSV